MSSEVAIRVDNVAKRYRIFARPFDRLLHQLFGLRESRCEPFDALHELGFTVRRGETLGLIGRNGAGKSTLLQIICGTLTPSAGSVSVNGRVAALLELGAGFNPEFTGRENVYMNAAIYGLDRAAIERALPSILAFAEIGDFIDRPVKTYSSGMFVRLAFAVIAHVRADILIIDEALAVGDVYFTQKCMRFLKRFKESGTLVFVSHDVNAVINLCDRAVWLDRGRIARQGPAKEVCEAYLGSFYPDADTGDNDGGANVAGRRGGEEFGTGSARIEKVELLDAAGRPLTLLLAAGRVELRVRCRAHVDIADPIVGFFVKDRLGQYLFGQNSLQPLPGWTRIAAGASVEVRFAFHMPHLASGDYSIGVSVAAGSQEKHVQHHWIHDALHFRAQADPALTGWFALEDLECRLHDPGSDDAPT